MLALLGWFALGLLLLVLGADSLVKGAGGVAVRLGMRPFMAGLLLVGLVSSTPELAVNLTAVWQSRFDLAFGTVIGSNIANIGLVLGAVALWRSLDASMRLLRWAVLALIVASIGLWVLSLDGRIGHIDGAILLTTFVVLLFLAVRQIQREEQPAQDALATTAESRFDTRRNVLRLLVGLGLVLYAAHLLVTASASLAALWGMSELLIGLVVVAFACALPELTAAALAAWRGHGDIALGGLVGSCLFNLLPILGISAHVQSLTVAKSLVWVELPAMIAFAAVLYPMIRGDLSIRRYEGGILLVAYLGFLLWELC